MRATNWIDVTVPLRNGMPSWPDNPPVKVERIMDLERGDEATVSRLSLGSHAGTHMDAPLHFLRSGKGLDEMPVEEMIGPARVIEIQHPRQITVEELSRYRIAAGERVLFKTRNSVERWAEREFMKDFVYLSTEAGHWLMERRIRAIGVDYLSIGGYEKNGPEVHRVLLKAGIWILEGLDLSKISGGLYDLICLPLKVLHSDGAPARAVVRPRRGAA